MFAVHGFPFDEEREFEAPEDEVVKEFLEARRVPRLVKAGERAGAAVAGYHSVYEYLGERYVA
jgi:hypothetical protein